MRRRILDTLGRLGSLFLDTLAVRPWFGQGPLVQGHYSSVAGRLRSSIALVGDGLAPLSRRIIYSHSKMGDFVGCFEMGFGERDPST